MSHDIFICYSARDKTVANAVCAIMEAEGVRCWIAPRDILPGADWGESIIDAINDARAMVLIFSSNANEAQSQIKREVERAINKGIPVIPFRIENVLPTKALEYFLSTPHWLDAFTPPLDGHVRQLADSTKRLLGKPVSDRPPIQQAAMPQPGWPLRHGAPPPHDGPLMQMPSLAQHIKPMEWKKMIFGEKTPGEWIKEPKHAIITGIAALIVLGGLWYEFRPVATPEDKAAWTVAATEDSIPAYQLYAREDPDGFYVSRAEKRIDELKAEVTDAFAKAKAANTQAAYATFVNTYAKQQIDIDEARQAYADVGAAENNMRIAYQRAAQQRSRAGYQAFLAQYGSSAYATDVRQRLASCHTENRTTTSMQNSTVQREGTGEGTDPTTACSVARNNALSNITSVCGQQQARLGAVRVLNQDVENGRPSGGQVVGSLLGSALFNRSVNVQRQYECTTNVQASCEKQISGAQAIEVCQ